MKFLSMTLLAFGLLAADPAEAFTGGKFNQSSKDRQPDVEYRAELKKCKQRHPGDVAAWKQCEAKAKRIVDERRLGRGEAETGKSKAK